MEEGENAMFHGHVIQLSLVKDRYFNGRISDGTTVARFISFQPHLRDSIKKFKSEHAAIAISGCRIQQNEYSSNLEIVTSRNSTDDHSPKKFKLEATNESQLITAEELSTIAVNQLVTLIGKVIRVDPSEKVTSKKGEKLIKQDCIIKDTKSLCRIVLWEGNEGKLTKDKSYKLHNVIVKQYGSIKYLSLAADNSTLEEIPDIENISDDDEGLIEPNYGLLAIMTVTGEIIAVQSVTDYLTCINCSTGTVRALNSTIGKCTKCATTQKLNQCSQSKSAQFVIINNEYKKFHITAYNEQLETLLTEHEYMSIEERLFINTNVTVHFYTKSVLQKVDKH